MRKLFILMFCLLLYPVLSYSQNGVLRQYINDALQRNLVLQQKNFSLKQSLAALKEARGMFLPSLGINARYSRAGGGRDFDIPVGDLVNPIYQSLNQILQQQAFPENIPNEKVNFLRREEHETKLRLIQPVFQPSVLYNYKIKASLEKIEQARRDSFARQLVADVKTAYFTYLKTIKVVEIYQATRLLLEENLRVSRSLFENNKVTRDVVYRAQAELSDLEQKTAEAERDRDLAVNYFNFLLNRPLEEAIIIENPQDDSLKNTVNLQTESRRALRNRDELWELESAITASENGIKLSNTAFLPGISFVFDYGYQGEKYRFTSRDDFWMGSVVLQWNIFNGFQDRAKIQKATLEKAKMESQRQNIENLIQLQVRQAFHNYNVALKTIKAARERRLSATKSFEIIDKKFRQGMASHIEFTDARTTRTQSEINEIVTTYDFYIRKAELEKVTANFALK